MSKPIVLEPNKVYCADWVQGAKSIHDKSVNLIIADPPYFEVKGEFDFVWDSFEDYLEDVEKWAIECKRLLANNGTLFWWGHAKKIAHSQIILDKYFKLENVIKWRKTDCLTRKGAYIFNGFPPVTEHLLMYSSFDVNLEGCIYHIRDYIRGEIKKSKGKIVLKDVNTALGTATNGGGVASACLSLNKGEPAMISEELYLKLQNWCAPHLRKDYKELHSEYKALREELLRPFNNHLGLEDVMDFPQDTYLIKKYGHPTQKPEGLTSVLVRTCSRKGNTLVVPFSGSGTECVSGLKAGLTVYGFDTDKRWVTTGNERMQEVLDSPTLF